MRFFKERDPKCIDCGELKEEEYKHFSSYCKKCKAVRAKIWNDKKRELLGKKPRSTEINLNCTKCGALGRASGKSWCTGCVNLQKRKLYAEKKAAGIDWYNYKKTCSACGKDKEETFLRETYCKSCHNEIIRAKRAKKRADQGLPAWGSNACSSCGGVKEEGYKEGSYCRTCRLKKSKEETMDRRKSLGLGQWGSGDRKIWCCNCGKEKENRDAGYCYECANILEREKYKKKYESPEERKLRYDKFNEKYQNDLIFKMKMLAQRKVAMALKKGILKIRPCEVCKDLFADAHHEDYSKPLEVKWLCRKHHMELHKQKKIDDNASSN